MDTEVKVQEVSIDEFIDFNNPEHMHAFKELINTGVWPELFLTGINDTVTFNGSGGHWYVNLLAKAVRHFLDKDKERDEVDELSGIDNPFNLTVNEVEALKLCLNSNSREGQLSDNFSNGGPGEFAQVLFDNDMHKSLELIKELEKKGLGWLDEREGDINVCVDDNFRPCKVKDEDKIFWLTEKGVNALFDFIDQMK